MTILLATSLRADDQAEWLALLQAALPTERFVTARHAAADHLADLVNESAIDVAVVANPPLGALQNLPNLRFIQSLWAGVETLLADSTVPTYIPLARMVDPAMNSAMAETALWAVLSLHRGYFECAAAQLGRRWQRLPQPRAVDVTVAVLGLGQMGGTAARRLAQNGYRVLGWSLTGNTETSACDGVQSACGEPALQQVLAAADIVVNLLPLTAATRGIFNTASFAQMRRGASLVNLARGAHVNDADLLTALNTGHLSRAVLDVFHTEPLPSDHAFWTHPKLTVLPHVAAQTDARSAVQVVAQNVARHRAGAQPVHLVNRQLGY